MVWTGFGDFTGFGSSMKVRQGRLGTETGSSSRACGGFFCL